MKRAEVEIMFHLRWPGEKDNDPDIISYVWGTKKGYFYLYQDDGKNTGRTRRISIKQFISYYEEFKNA